MNIQNQSTDNKPSVTLGKLMIIPLVAVCFFFFVFDYFRVRHRTEIMQNDINLLQDDINLLRKDLNHAQEIFKEEIDHNKE